MFFSPLTAQHSHEKVAHSERDGAAFLEIIGERLPVAVLRWLEKNAVGKMLFVALGFARCKEIFELLWAPIAGGPAKQQSD
jgi:hypothetical protein